jgi:hypothetical protein
MLLAEQKAKKIFNEFNCFRHNELIVPAPPYYRKSRYVPWIIIIILMDCISLFLGSFLKYSATLVQIIPRRRPIINIVLPPLQSHDKNKNYEI